MSKIVRRVMFSNIIDDLRNEGFKVIDSDNLFPQPRGKFKYHCNIAGLKGNIESGGVNIIYVNYSKFNKDGNRDEGRTTKAGRMIKEIFEMYGFMVNWDGDPDKAIHVVGYNNEYKNQEGEDYG